jgi:WD40 repeat protein
MMRVPPIPVTQSDDVLLETFIFMPMVAVTGWLPPQSLLLLLLLLCRLLRECLLELAGHSHWVWQVAHSPFHDSLLLSSSTDTTVCVWFTPALAKAKGVESRATTVKSSATSTR